MHLQILLKVNYNAFNVITQNCDAEWKMVSLTTPRLLIRFSAHLLCKMWDSKDQLKNTFPLHQIEGTINFSLLN